MTDFPQLLIALPVNLMRHDCAIVSPEGETIVIPPSGVEASVEMEIAPFGAIGEVRIVSNSYGPVVFNRREGNNLIPLPGFQLPPEGVIVWALVAARLAPDARVPIFAPNTGPGPHGGVRLSPEGPPTGARSLILYNLSPEGPPTGARSLILYNPHTVV